MPRDSPAKTYKLALYITFVIISQTVILSTLFYHFKQGPLPSQKGQTRSNNQQTEKIASSASSSSSEHRKNHLPDEASLEECHEMLDRHQPFRFVSYVPSPLEVRWNKSIAELKQDWNHTGCPRIQAEMPQYEAWLKAAASQKPTEISEKDPVLSHFVYHDLTNHDRVFRVPIEPLMGLLRHPRAVCVSEAYEDIVRKDWLMLPHSSYFPRIHGRKLFFDIGSSIYRDGSGGPSQEWFVTEYASRGMEFDHIYAWEVIVHPPSTIFEDLPPHMLHRFSYYNVPVQEAPTALHNPIRVMKAAAKVSDYVIMKLDIDMPTLEMALVRQLLADEDAMKLVDEFFFEVLTYTYLCFHACINT
jgi:hypothetical protein